MLPTAQAEIPHQPGKTKPGLIGLSGHSGISYPGMRRLSFDYVCQVTSPQRGHRPSPCDDYLCRWRGDGWPGIAPPGEESASRRGGSL